MSPANVRYKLPNLRTTPSSSRPSYTVEENHESEDELSFSKNSLGAKGTGKMAKGKGKEKRNGEIPFKALPMPVKSSQTVGKWNETFGMCSSLV